ncbi:UNKNOWN [Stylonychia lemnae]|uniref:Arrestin-like N-terminal domain-containing protein n=1 Tax=Stylonychia lemnae TaxID=5949 RepID=A0A077ZN90_STYLE|nr:UNKNOWN [Stylonychia lemnae]|eukprot:CDW71388.1 UNKNOWN [Stylonychia lemnae]
MGNADSHVKQEYGYLYIQTNQSHYEPGQQVIGTIFIRTMMPLEVSTINIEVKGVEKGGFTVTRSNGKSTHRERRWYTHRHIKYDQPCFNFAVDTLQPGDYAVPFQFNLPLGIPATMFLNDPKHRDHPKMKVKYTLRANLKNKVKKNLMFFKQIIKVVEPIIEYKQDLQNVSERKVTTCCCINQGISRIEAHFDRNIFYAHENCRAEIKIDNSKCNINITDSRLAIEQHIYIKAGWDVFRNVYTLGERYGKEVRARDAQISNQVIDLPLSTIRYEVHEEKKKDGSMKIYSDQEKFLMGQLQAASHGKQLTNEYFVAIRCNYQGCTCCRELPHIKVPVAILPTEVPDLMRQQTEVERPDDYNPIYYKAYEFDLTNEV